MLSNGNAQQWSCSGVGFLRNFWMYLFLVVVALSNNVCFVHSITVVKQPSPPTFLPETSASTAHWKSQFSTCPKTHALHMPRTNTGSRWWGRRAFLPLRDTTAILWRDRPALLTWPPTTKIRTMKLPAWRSHHHSTWAFYGLRALQRV